MLVNLRDYPIDDFKRPELQEKIANWRETFSETGICLLENFVTSRTITQMVREANALLPFRYKHSVVGNAYLTEVDEALPKHHAERIVERTTQSTVAYDQIPEECSIRRLYEWDALDRLIQSILGCEHLYHYACPLGAINLAVMEAGDYLRWHFDQTDFVVSLHLQSPEAGGRYEYVSNLKTDTDPNYEGVKALHEGRCSDVKTLETNPGTLILFRGRNTIHRVTEVEGKTPRLVALYSYAYEPDVDSTKFLKQMRYGRTRPITSNAL